MFSSDVTIWSAADRDSADDVSPSQCSALSDLEGEGQCLNSNSCWHLLSGTKLHEAYLQMRGRDSMTGREALHSSLLRRSGGFAPKPPSHVKQLIQQNPFNKRRLTLHCSTFRVHRAYRVHRVHRLLWCALKGPLVAHAFSSTHFSIRHVKQRTPSWKRL